MGRWTLEIKKPDHHSGKLLRSLWFMKVNPHSTKTVPYQSSVASLCQIFISYNLIAINGASAASSFDIVLINLPMHLTPFDRILIFDSFKGHIVEGKKIMNKDYCQKTPGKSRTAPILTIYHTRSNNDDEKK